MVALSRANRGVSCAFLFCYDDSTMNIVFSVTVIVIRIIILFFLFIKPTSTKSQQDEDMTPTTTTHSGCPCVVESPGFFPGFSMP